jgi:hypothetical protein
MAELPKLDQNLRAAMSELGVPRGVSRSTGETIVAAMHAWQNELSTKSPEELQMHFAETKALVSRVAKVDYATMVASIKPMVAAMKPETREWMAKSGAVESPAVILSLWRASQLRAARSGM